MYFWVMGILPLTKNLPLSQFGFFSVLGLEAVFASETFVATNQTTGLCYNEEYSNWRQCPFFCLCELSSAAINKISPCRADSPKGDFGKFRLW